MPPHFLTLDRVTKTFSGRGKRVTHIIDEVSLAIAQGEFVVFLGPSGCGKTTLMRMCSGLEHPTTGVIRLGGEVVTKPDRRKGMVFQSYSSFPWLTVFDNVLFGMRYRSDLSPAAKKERAKFYLNLVDLTDFGQFYINRISGGMRQRVALARTLAADPDILLMDEPFGALDAQTRDFLQIQLLNICRIERKTVVFVTHDVEEAVFLGDRIVMFSARPAQILETIQVGEYLVEERTLRTKETQAFFKLRNHVLDVVRSQAQAPNLPQQVTY